MDCPFPGMDPYLERREIWPDFHDRFITHLSEALQPMLRPQYAAISQNRLYVVEHERPIYPDVSVIESPDWSIGGGATATAVLPDLDEPLIVEIESEEIRQPMLHIIEPAAGNRIVAAIEVLSPDNKMSGPGRESYRRKCDELWEAGAHLIEIDLLRDGQRVPRVAAARIPPTPAWNYIVSVSRWHSRLELYRFGLKQRLPRIAIPLAYDDKDVRLDLPAVFTRCWQAGPYPALLHYDAPPPGTLLKDDLDWCQQQVAKLTG